MKVPCGRDVIFLIGITSSSWKEMFTDSESIDRVWLSWRRNSLPNSLEYFSAVVTLDAPTKTFAGKASILSATLSP